jgi:hypothetical protein
VSVIEPEGAGSEVSVTILTAIDSEFSVEVFNIVKTLFYEARALLAILVRAMCGSEVHIRTSAKAGAVWMLNYSYLEIVSAEIRGWGFGLRRI